jgi:signal transduction histidine kinase
MESRLQRLETVQEIVLEISQISSQSTDIREFLAATHKALNRIMHAANFYVALFSAEHNALQFIYFTDEKDPAPDPTVYFKLDEPGSSFTKWIIQHKKPLVLRDNDDEKISALNLDEVTGTRSEHWMGYPLFDHRKHILGAMVCQSYDVGRLYSLEDQALFGLIANHVSHALQALQSVDKLERAVAERTASLAHEVKERRRSEQIQQALFSIAELTFSATEACDLYQRLHSIVDQIITAKNFVVALYHSDTEEISIHYFVDEKADLPDMHRFPMGVGMTSFVIRTGKPQLIDQARLQQLMESGEIKQVLGGSDTQSWMGVPILINQKIYGVIIVQSYDAHALYSDTDLELLSYVASHISIVIERINADNNQRISKENLEQQNQTLNEALCALQEAQDELVRKEKMASLGGLVAGVAHEINTPLGICVTATSHLIEELRLTRIDISDKKLTEKKFNQFLDTIDQSLSILNSNTKRAASLVRSFKQVAVDQTSDDKRQFNVASYIDEVLHSLHPKLKNKKITIQVNCDKELNILSYPGALSQILTNFIMNSIIHGFEHKDQGSIHISVTQKDNNIELIYSDDGHGLTHDALKKLFDPFFTTKRGQGGSGLGTHIVFNLVTNSLLGNIHANSNPEQGLSYHITFPL